MQAKLRLEQIKQLDKATSSEKMIFLLNPKDTRVYEALVAWKTIHVEFNGEKDINDNMSIEGLWDMCQMDIREFAVTVGDKVQDALPRLKQLKNLHLIYPDGSINENARIIVSMYIKKKIMEVRGNAEDE